jgi:nitrile hydratase accessory protein
MSPPGRAQREDAPVNTPDPFALSGFAHGDPPPVFSEPWQAQAFAMVLSLHQRGVFTWPEWAQALATQIAAAQARGDADLGDTYYQHWLAALEAIVAAKGAATTDELLRTQRAWDHAADRTPHGQAISLQAGDFDA